MSDENEFWGGSDFIYTCLIDKKRTNAFKRVILNSVKKNDIVADLGSGTGILARFALKAGAKRVYVVEADKNIFSVLRKNFSDPAYKDKIILINKDASSIKIPEKLDVLICEMIATGLIDEFQIPVMNAMQKYLKPTTKIIPEQLISYIDIVNNKNSFYGEKLNIVRYEYGDYVDNQTWNTIQLSNKYEYSAVHFGKRNKDIIDQKIILDIHKNGIMNGLRISSATQFPDGSTLGNTLAYCMPLILPLDDTKVKKGDRFMINLKYKMCSNLSNLRYEAKKLA